MGEFLNHGSVFFTPRTGDPALSAQLALRAVERVRLQQASSLAYLDVFWVSAVLGGVLVFLGLLMRRSVAEPGAHVAAE